MWKDHTNVYEAFRRSYRATIIPLNKNNASSKAVFENEVYTRLAPDEDEALELETMSPGHSTFASRTWGPPSPIVGRWLQAYVEFQGFLENLTNAIERLSSEYQRHTIDWTRRWQEEGGGGGPSATGESSITDHLFGQVTGMFAVAPSKVERLVNPQVGLLGTDWKQIKENVRRALYERLAHLADRLRQVQATAATQQQLLLRSMKNVRSKLSNSGSPLTSFETPSSNEFVGEAPATDKKTLLIDEDLLDKEIAQERSQKIDHLVRSMAQVIELLQSMSTLVAHQGGLLDRIDVNLERSRHYVQKANVKLTTVRGGQVGQMRKMILLFLLLLIFILLIAVFSPRQ